MFRTQLLSLSLLALLTACGAEGEAGDACESVDECGDDLVCEIAEGETEGVCTKDDGGAGDTDPRE